MRPTLSVPHFTPPTQAADTVPPCQQLSGKGEGACVCEGARLVCLLQDTKGISAQTFRQLESLLRTQREQTARSFREFRSLREKLNKEVTSRVKQRWESTSGGSQPEGQPPGKGGRWALRPQERIPFWLQLVCMGGGSSPPPGGGMFL